MFFSRVWDFNYLEATLTIHIHGGKDADKQLCHIFTGLEIGKK